MREKSDCILEGLGSSFLYKYFIYHCFPSNRQFYFFRYPLLFYLHDVFTQALNKSHLIHILYI